MNKSYGVSPDIRYIKEQPYNVFTVMVTENGIGAITDKVMDEVVRELGGTSSELNFQEINLNI